MNGIDLEHRYAELEWEGQGYHRVGLTWYFRSEYEGILRWNHGHHLTELAVSYVCRTIIEDGLWEISTNAFSKRVGMRYHSLRVVERIPWHTRPKLTVRCMEKLIAFICAVPQDIRHADALDGVFVYCIEYRESKLERWWRKHLITPGEDGKSS